LEQNLSNGSLPPKTPNRTEVASNCQITTTATSSGENCMTPWSEWREAPQAEFGVLGDPVGHSLSPQMQSAAFAVLGLNYRYVAIRIPVGEFNEALTHLQSLSYRGLNVTVPLKEAAFQWCQTTDELTGRIRAANTLAVQDERGTNTDAPGIQDVLMQVGVPFGANVLLLGAGGAARAVAAGLERGGFPFSIHNRSRDKAEELVSDLGLISGVLSAPDPSGFDVIINATSASLTGAVVPVDWELARPGCIAIDLVYSEGPTPFMQEAAAFGLTTVDGRALLVAQGARSLEWWLGVEAPRSAMLKAIS
jgi:shikimate dehydrogenase